MKNKNELHDKILYEFSFDVHCKEIYCTKHPVRETKKSYISATGTFSKSDIEKLDEAGFSSQYLTLNPDRDKIRSAFVNAVNVSMDKEIARHNKAMKILGDMMDFVKNADIEF